jgi:hypothetical protein
MRFNSNFWTHFGEKLCANGYHAFPLRPHSKRSTWAGWQKFCNTAPTPEQIERWTTRYADHSIAIACGHTTVAVDIDELNPARAHRLAAMAFLFLGDTSLIRIGRSPKRILLYAVEGPPIPTWRRPAIEVLGIGAYFVAYGIHPDIAQPYVWDEDSPCDTPVTAIPRVTAAQIQAFQSAIETLLTGKAPSAVPLADKPTKSGIRPFQSGPWVKDERGLVIDGRDSFLARCVYDAAGGHRSAETIADMAWSVFETRSCLKRPKRGGKRPWSREDALAKARALLRKPVRPSGPTRVRLPRGDDGFWTQPAKSAFQNSVRAAGARRDLPPAAVKVSDLMLGLVYGDGACSASVETIACETELSIDTVKKARRQLRAGGYWRSASHLDSISGRFHGLYQPNPACLHDMECKAKPELADEIELVAISNAEEPNWEDLIASR